MVLYWLSSSASVLRSLRESFQPVIYRSTTDLESVREKKSYSSTDTMRLARFSFEERLLLLTN